jgi:hypothetical protein
MAEIFHQKTIRLAAAIEDDRQHDGTRQSLRRFIDTIVIPPGEGMLQVVGNLTETLAAAARYDGVAYVGCGGAQPSIPTALYVVAA